MPSDEELMERYRTGDRAAFTELFRRYAPLVLRVMEQQLGKGEDAYDLVQQTFLQLHRSKDDFPRGEPLRPWLFTIAVNLHRRHLRRVGNPSEIAVKPEPLEEPHSGFSVKGTADARELASLTGPRPDQRDIVELHWIQRLSFSEIEKVVRAILSIVKVRAQRAYVAIRKIFAEGRARADARSRARGRGVGTQRSPSWR